METKRKIFKNLLLNYFYWPIPSKNSLVLNIMLQQGRSQTNKLPSKTDSRNYLTKIREEADQGDVNAMGWLVLISEFKKAAKHNEP